MVQLSYRELDALAGAISERLQVIVPEGIAPSVGVAYVWWTLDDLVNQPGSIEENLANASERILDNVQDEIARDLKEGWPRAVGRKPGDRDAGKDLPMPETAVVSGTLRLWYGDARRPALELPPIHLAELGVIGQ